MPAVFDAAHWICHYWVCFGFEYSLWRSFISLWLWDCWWPSGHDGFFAPSALHVLPGDPVFGKTFLELHFYAWGYVGYTGFLLGLTILLMLPNRAVRSRSWFANTILILFILLVFGNLVSTLLECGIGPCADDPVKYEGLLWLRSRFGFLI
nr:hypothetical protein [Polynucleobacter necessarius]